MEQEDLSHHVGSTKGRGHYIILPVVVLFAIFMIWLGTVCVRLWYYKGSLGPDYEVFDIEPEYLKERFRRSIANFSSQASNRGRNAQHGALGGSSKFESGNRHTVFPNPNLDREQDRGRWTGVVRINVTDENGDEVPLRTWDDEIRKYVAEERRISRLPAFVQDDCGDGSEFPNIPFADERVEEPSTTERLNLLQPRPTKQRTNFVNYHQMGLTKLDRRDWLLIDNTYQEFHEARDYLLRKKTSECVQVTPEGEEACEELMKEVTCFLTERYPDFFKIRSRHGIRNIRNEITKEEFSLQRPYDCHPLEVCARLAMEDFNILMKGEFTGQHYLQASATLFPAGWRLRQRIGKSVTDLHGPVPLWEDIPDILNLSYFNRLNENSPMERSSMFIQIKPDERSLADLLFIQQGKDFFPGDLSHLLPQWIIIRRERQTFKRLPKSDAIVFTVKTNIQRLVDLPEEQLPTLAREIKSWPSDIATYKGRDLWQRAVIGYCEKKSIIHDDFSVVNAGALTQISEDEG